jgi:thiamine biosynthesis protein ThiI
VSVTIAPPEIVLVRYGELALKKGNRGEFERALVRNMRYALKHITPVKCERTAGRITVRPETRAADAARRLQDVFGIKTVSPAWTVEALPESIAEISGAVLKDALLDYPQGRPVTFRVRTRRSNKRFPVQSTDFDRFIAERILPGPERVKVQLKDPELELGIEIRDECAYVFLRRLAGPGGLPVGTLGSVLCLLSGGIDSPVAAWKTMKRGCDTHFITFHSYPYIGEASKKKVIDLARSLARWQRKARVHVTPFTEIQETIRDNCPEGYRTVLYRRMMQRIASRVAEQRGYQALVTGESVGQVASQTLENMTCIGAAADIPVLRPLVTFDKEETIEVARRIGTFDLSNVQEPDCCTVFQPARPVIRGRLEKCLEAEALMDVDALVERALAGVETIDVEAQE